MTRRLLVGSSLYSMSMTMAMARLMTLEGYEIEWKDSSKKLKVEPSLLYSINLHDVPAILKDRPNDGRETWKSNRNLFNKRKWK